MLKSTFIHNSTAIFSCCRFSDPRNVAKSPKILTYSSTRSSKVIDLGVNRKRNCYYFPEKIIHAGLNTC